MTELEKSLLRFLASYNDGEYRDIMLRVDFMKNSRLADKVDQDRVSDAINSCIEKGYMELDESLHRISLTPLGRSQI